MVYIGLYRLRPSRILLHSQVLAEEETPPAKAVSSVGPGWAYLPSPRPETCKFGFRIGCCRFCSFNACFCWLSFRVLRFTVDCSISEYMVITIIVYYSMFQYIIVGYGRLWLPRCRVTACRRLSYCRCPRLKSSQSRSLRRAKCLHPAKLRHQRPGNMITYQDI